MLRKLEIAWEALLTC